MRAALHSAQQAVAGHSRTPTMVRWSRSPKRSRRCGGPPVARSSGRRFANFQVCRPGDTVAVPLGGVWHVSYVLDGPAAVFNISANLNGLVTNSNHDDKYRRGAR